jgi:hypothetical protein
MRRSLAWVLVLLTQSATGHAQNNPSNETIALSLRTMNKALNVCNKTYADYPEIAKIVGPKDSAKDKSVREMATKVSDFLASHPDQISAKGLVMVFSTSDDVSVGVGSSRTELLAAAIKSPSQITPLLAASTSLYACQQALFNAGDDYVDLVLKRIGEEENALVTLSKRVPGSSK